MAALASSNVVNLNEFDRIRRPAPPVESARLLDECRDFAARRLAEAVRGTIDRLEEDLFLLADASFDRETQNLYLEARGRARQCWSQVETTFARGFVDEFNRKARGEVPSASPASVHCLELSLIDDNALTEDLAVKDLAARLKEACDEELHGVLQRMGLLLGKEELSDQENPFGPEGICEALRLACGVVHQTNWALRLVLLKTLGPHLSSVLAEIYAELNRQLQSANILPDLRRGYRRPVNASAGEAGAGTAKRATEGGLERADMDLLARLQRLFQLQNTASAPNAAAPIAAAEDAVLVKSPAPLELIPAPASDSDSSKGSAFLDSLTWLQRGERRAPGQGEASEPAVLPLVAATANVVRQLKTTGFAASAGQLDSITIDIVAMLFDFIFDDSKIPDAIKALVGRLQIPVLKVALLDQTFFSSKAHPARKLLDTISSVAMRWGKEIDAHDPIYLKIAQIAGRIQEDFDRDVQIFVEMQAELEGALRAAEAEEESFVGRSAEVLERREHEEIGRVVAGEHIKHRITDTVPEAVREFLLEHWQQVLKAIYVRLGEENDVWRRALSTVEDLIWSVAPKNGAEERRRLVALLPDLLRRLHEGLDLIPLSHTQRAPFLDVLVGLHSAAVKAGLQASPFAELNSRPSVWQEKAIAAAPQHTTDEASASEEGDEGELVVTRTTENEIQIEDVVLIGGRPAPLHGGDIHTDRVNNLRRGDWVEFRSEVDVVARRRLSWVSPKRCILLFTAYPAATALSISPDALAHQFRNGLAGPVRDEPLFDRAVNSMLDALQIGV